MTDLYTCDRCGGKCPNYGPAAFIDLTTPDEVVIDKHLCQDCWEEFWLWWRLKVESLA